MNHDQNKNAAPLLITAILVLSISYAVLRYHVAGPVPWKDFPFFILNKGFSLAAFVLIACNFGFGPLRNLGVPLPDSWLVARKAVGMTGFLLVLIHALMSFLLFKPAVYANFFAADGTLTLLAGLSMLAGVLFMGYEGWMKPGGWHGGLPPISLVAFAVFAMAYVVNLFGRE
jgi:DMSO/TMAO reductase YedYZ heme-binding membrane subunit